MRKRDEIELPESCFNKAADHEQIFVLLARDPAAPVAIVAWVMERIRLGKNSFDDPQIIEALDCARRMEEERNASEAMRFRQASLQGIEVDHG
ncbi:MAG: hypothetical protein Q6370_014430 [Candidatus Sigynarchaeota archaeon]